jgi:hypothetical protein
MGWNTLLGVTRPFLLPQRYQIPTPEKPLSMALEDLQAAHEGLSPLTADSERCRSAFRSDGELPIDINE